MKIAIEDLKLLGYYPYVSHVSNVVCEYDGFIYNKGDELAKDLYEDIVKKMENLKKLDCVDNKSAYMVLHMPTNTVLYIGCYDSHYRIGLSCTNESGKFIEF